MTCTLRLLRNRSRCASCQSQTAGSGCTDVETQLPGRNPPRSLGCLLCVKSRACREHICPSTRAQCRCIYAALMSQSIRVCGEGGTSWWAGLGRATSSREYLAMAVRRRVVCRRLVSMTLAMSRGFVPDETLANGVWITKRRCSYC